MADFSVYIEQLKGPQEAQFHFSHVTHKKDKIFSICLIDMVYAFLQINLHEFFLLIFLAIYSNFSLVSGVSNNGIESYFECVYAQGSAFHTMFSETNFSYICYYH